MPAAVPRKKSPLERSMGPSRLSWVISSHGAPARISLRSRVPSSTETTLFGMPSVIVAPTWTAALVPPAE